MMVILVIVVIHKKVTHLGLITHMVGYLSTIFSNFVKKSGYSFSICIYILFYLTMAFFHTCMYKIKCLNDYRCINFSFHADFFGPVQASFIRPGQLSDSTSSDENNDVTKDSTFFSMHFRSLARSDSGGDLKTSTSVHLSFEEKTPTQDSIQANVGSSMVLTIAKKPNPLSSTPIAKLSSGNDSNDMSLVGESPNRYDFGRLSPELDALLAEGSKDLHAVTISDNTSVSKSPTNMEGSLLASKEHEGGLMDLIDDGDNEIGGITHGMPKEVVSVVLSLTVFHLLYLGLHIQASHLFIYLE